MAYLANNIKGIVVTYKSMYEVPVTGNGYIFAICFSKDFCRKILRVLNSLRDFYFRNKLLFESC